MSNCTRSRWKLAEQVIQVRINLVQHTQPSNTTSMTQRQENSDRGKTWPSTTPGARQAEGDIQLLTPTSESNTQGLREQLHNRYEVT